MFIVFWITLLFRTAYRRREAITELSVDRVGRWRLMAYALKLPNSKLKEDMNCLLIWNYSGLLGRYSISKRERLSCFKRVA